ncbi:hypothetical protein [Synechococcus sp. WH 8101]|uniref:hypothetical protein n=1 Tax=Synechococcus sp. WH 8101 TaxID=59932 RepID=UPI001023ED75|nr:hypothetical protein [Synechococcus sp. WH 8101]
MARVAPIPELLHARRIGDLCQVVVMRPAAQASTTATATGINSQPVTIQRRAWGCLLSDAPRHSASA